ncbi:hypothetical protein CA233_10865 [Sphingomonas sp. ABOLD]|uniref:AbiV family abortive infection protein n=1 Tax=Sphingomonas trueperi TaxID=53317 RepID=A0A7X6BAZ2_9SPHN|nr:MULTISPECIES: hypothetical protein [Sphingomonas]NJB95943.1 hypothetical protein [Sphingomonas trueperi]RSV47816.1 hypothetical protein CA233_10865 [Sphingomonas sp. ABOLD]
MTVEEDLWIYSDESEDVAGSLRHALRCIDYVKSDPQAWKWFALALHSALQGACVCHLTTSLAPVGAVTKRNAAEWISFVEKRRTNPAAEVPRTELMSLPDLLKAVRKPYSAGDRSNSAGIAISDRELTWIRRFHDEVRNQFVHFEPMGWALEVSGLPEIGKFVARIIGEILEAGYGFRHRDLAWRDALAADVSRLSSLGLLG